MSNEINKRIGNRIRFFRKARGYTLITFAQELHCSKSTISKYERGEISMNIEMLMEIAKILEISLYQLLGEASPEIPTLFNLPNTEDDVPTKKMYLYSYCGHKQAYISRSVLILGKNTVYLYEEVDNEEDYFTSKYIYSGEIHHTESFCHLLLSNSVIENDIVIIEFFKPLNYSRAFTGFFCTFSIGPYFPLCCKIILSENIITDEKWIKEQLVISKEDIKTMRQLNAFSVNFTTF